MSIKSTPKSTPLSIAIAALLSIASGTALAAEHVVKMLNQGSDGQYMVFEPALIEAEPGDTVKFVATDQYHNAETIPELWPDGAPTFKGALSTNVTFTIEKPGIYGVRCQPHYPLGMIALVVAGEPVNADQLSAYKPAGATKERFEALTAKLPQ